VSRDVAWTDLLDPGREQLLAGAPAELLPLAVAELLAPGGLDGPPRPAIESHGSYLLAILLVPVAVPVEDRVYYQEVDVVATHDAVLTVRKTPAGGDPPFPAEELAALCANRERAGTLVHGIVDEIAERFLALIDALEDEIDEIEEGIESAQGSHTRRRIAELRRSIVGVRRILGPTRDAMRRVLDARVVVHGETELFPTELRLLFGDTYDKLLRATEGLDAARELLASVRDYDQARIAENQNAVVKTLTVVASLVLVPTLITGFYGQNFAGEFGEAYWSVGVAVGLIIGTTIVQLAVFAWRGWL
jgi:magnesium transporter